MAKRFNYRDTMQRAVNQHVEVMANIGRELVIDIHLSAPRGGEYENQFGQMRSAEGEQPAQETGELLSRLQQPVTVRGYSAFFNVNYDVLETGGLTEFGSVAARPMGQMTVNQLRQAYGK